MGESDEREGVASELRELREQQADIPVGARSSGEVLGSAPVERPVAAHPLPADAPVPPPPVRPPFEHVDATWDVSRALPGGRWLSRLAERLLRPLLEAQTRFNSRQVQLDLGLVEYLERRLDVTHRHYDSVLGLHGRHMQEIDERHLLLQQDLVGHVHDLVRRIDLVLGEQEQSRVSLEAALRDLRARLRELQGRLAGE